MKPHYIFTRQIHGVTTTIEINSGHVSAHRIVDEKRIPILESIRITKGITPFWSYQSGFDGPIWNDPYSYVYAGGSESPIQLLRMVVAMLTSGNHLSTCKPKLGFHSKYKAAKRREQEISRAA